MKIENAKFVFLIENKYVELTGYPIPISISDLSFGSKYNLSRDLGWRNSLEKPSPKI